ncbi:MAG: nuclear transport factor 2 family protein [Bacteroidota bacterium]
MRSVLLSLAVLATTGVAAQPTPADADFADRAAILATIEAFYIGDHTGSEAHRRASMDPRGAYRYVDREGVYRESRFELVEGGADTSYVEELLSVEIYETVALARVRLESERRDEAEYKLMTLHKTAAGWRITTIAWGWGVTP